MARLAAAWRITTQWYVIAVLIAGLGVLAGYLLFFNALQGRPQIGVIDIPFTIIDDDSAFFIGEMLDFVSRTDSIKAVVIKLNSPGGGVTPSEQLFLKTLNLREKKPVIVAADQFLASGGYMMAMGANEVFVKPSSIVGSIGVRVRFGPPATPSDFEIETGPSKLTGGTERDLFGELEQLKESFLQIVLTQRGDRLKITPQELVEARTYTGLASVRLGLADAVGNDTDAIERAASLARISHYRLVDINVEVQRLLFKKIIRMIEPLEPLLSTVEGAEGRGLDLETLTSLLLSRGLGESQGRVPPDFPIDVNLPQFFYLYAIPPR